MTSARRCPDGGACHHECDAECWRRFHGGCEPLSGVFPGDVWPEPPPVTGLTCGERDEPDDWPCARNVWRTHGPAGSLWCPDHGHLMDVLAQPPLDLSGVIVCPR